MCKPFAPPSQCQWSLPVKLDYKHGTVSAGYGYDRVPHGCSRLFDELAHCSMHGLLLVALLARPIRGRGNPCHCDCCVVSTAYSEYLAKAGKCLSPFVSLYMYRYSLQMMLVSRCRVPVLERVQTCDAWGLTYLHHLH
jgi:hypothetical protein